MKIAREKSCREYFHVLNKNVKIREDEAASRGAEGVVRKRDIHF
jgi:hypothetical protein